MVPVRTPRLLAAHLSPRWSCALNTLATLTCSDSFQLRAMARLHLGPSVPPPQPGSSPRAVISFVSLSQGSRPSIPNVCVLKRFFFLVYFACGFCVCVWFPPKFQARSKSGPCPFILARSRSLILLWGPPANETLGLPRICSSADLTHCHVWSKVEKSRAMQLYPKHSHSLAVPHSSGFTASEKRVLLDHTKEFSGIVALCQEKLFTVRYSIPVTEKVLQSVWADGTCKFLSVSLWDREHPYCDAEPWRFVGGWREEGMDESSSSYCRSVCFYAFTFVFWHAGSLSAFLAVDFQG